MNNKIAAIVLAAGKGKRMNSKNFNKVVLPLGNRPMITYAIGLLEALKINPIIIVVGFAKKSVIDLLKGKVIFAEQKKRLGTAHAVICGLRALNVYSSRDQAKPESREVSSENSSRQARTVTRNAQSVDGVLVLNGDDSAFYTKETISKLIKSHINKKASVTFLTIGVDNPEGLGRVIRDNKGNLIAVIEDKDAHPMHKLINEVNSACYVFNLDFLRRYLPKIEKSKVTGEYYLTRLIDIAVENKEKVETVRGGRITWRGINTVEELKEAQKLWKFI